MYLLESEDRSDADAGRGGRTNTNGRWRQTFARRVFGLILLALATLAQPVRAEPAAGIQFAGARLGMSQAGWKALAPPGKISPSTKSTCSNDRTATGLTLSADERSANVVVCAYIDALGKFSLPVGFTFDQKYWLDHLRYWFVGGRLTQIRGGVSLDGFDALNDDFTRLYGPARFARDYVKTEVGLLPRVTETWSTPQGSVELVDPVLPADEIGIRFSAADILPHPLQSPSR